jgi:hypothetical protein
VIRPRSGFLVLAAAALSACAANSPFREPGSAGSASISGEGTIRVIRVDGVRAPWSVSEQLDTGTGFDPSVVVSAGPHMLLVVYKLSGEEVKTSVEVDAREGYSYLVRGYTQGYGTKIWVESRPVQQNN